MDFSASSSVVINNKVVTSIVRAKDNVILYEKREPAYDYIVDNTTDLVAALTSIQEGESLYIMEGEYVLIQPYAIPPCTIIGDNATIKSYSFHLTTASETTAYDISGITFNGNGVDRGDNGMLKCQANADIRIHDCHFTNITAKWNAHSIMINPSYSGHKTEIDHCLFDGNNATSGFGHTKASIAAFNLATVYNLDIHHNTFNHPTGGSNTVWNGKGIACFNNRAASTLVNCHAYCNQYLGAGDWNSNITEETCPNT